MFRVRSGTQIASRLCREAVIHRAQPPCTSNVQDKRQRIRATRRWTAHRSSCDTNLCSIAVVLARRLSSQPAACGAVKHLCRAEISFVPRNDARPFGVVSAAVFADRQCRLAHDPRAHGDRSIGRWRARDHINFEILRRTHRGPRHRPSRRRRNDCA